MKVIEDTSPELKKHESFHTNGPASANQNE